MRSPGASLIGKLLLLFTLSLTAASASASRPTGRELGPTKLDPSVLANAQKVSFSSSVEVELAREMNAQNFRRPVFVADVSGRLVYFGEVEEFVKPGPEISPLDCCKDGKQPDRLLLAKPNDPPGPCCMGDGYVSLSPDLEREVQKAVISGDLTGAAFTLDANGRLIQFSTIEKLAPLKQEAKVLDKPIWGPKDLPTDG